MRHISIELSILPPPPMSFTFYRKILEQWIAMWRYRGRSIGETRCVTINKVYRGVSRRRRCGPTNIRILARHGPTNHYNDAVCARIRVARGWCAWIVDSGPGCLSTNKRRMVLHAYRSIFGSITLREAWPGPFVLQCSPAYPIEIYGTCQIERLTLEFLVKSVDVVLRQMVESSLKRTSVLLELLGNSCEWIVITERINRKYFVVIEFCDFHCKHRYRRVNEVWSVH